jgi:hypothetical protein
MAEVVLLNQAGKVEFNHNSFDRCCEFLRRYNLRNIGNGWWADNGVGTHGAIYVNPTGPEMFQAVVFLSTE